MNDTIRDVTVAGYEHLIGQIDLLDPDDRHVLAAAIHADAQVIVTHNLRDFPSERLTTWGVHAQHPDEFLAGLQQDRPGGLSEVVAAIARTWGDDATPDDVLDRLAVDAPRSADLMRHALGATGRARCSVGTGIKMGFRRAQTPARPGNHYGRRPPGHNPSFAGSHR